MDNNDNYRDSKDSIIRALNEEIESLKEKLNSLSKRKSDIKINLGDLNIDSVTKKGEGYCFSLSFGDKVSFILTARTPEEFLALDEKYELVIRELPKK